VLAALRLNKGENMASRNFSRVQALEKEIKHLYAEVSIGATGAPTLDRGYGITSIERDSAGVYVLTLDDKYPRLMHMHVMMLEATAEDLTFQIESEDVNGDKTIQFQCKAAAVETDPSSGSKLLIKIDLKNTSAI
jgi:hypothetical protein